MGSNAHFPAQPWGWSTHLTCHSTSASSAVLSLHGPEPAELLHHTAAINARLGFTLLLVCLYLGVMLLGWMHWQALTSLSDAHAHTCNTQAALWNNNTVSKCLCAMLKLPENRFAGTLLHPPASTREIETIPAVKSSAKAVLQPEVRLSLFIQLHFCFNSWKFF